MAKFKFTITFDFDANDIDMCKRLYDMVMIANSGEPYIHSIYQEATNRLNSFLIELFEGEEIDLEDIKDMLWQNDGYIDDVAKNAPNDLLRAIKTNIVGRI